MKYIITISSLLLLLQVQSQEIIGKWKTIDDETGKQKSIVEIYVKEGEVYGKILELFRSPEEDQDPYCDKCEDDRKDQRVIGMEILRKMVKDDDQWEDGEICDPKDGKIYACKMWIDEDNSDVLNVRGYILFLYRTQQWHRIK